MAGVLVWSAESGFQWGLVEDFWVAQVPGQNDGLDLSTSGVCGKNRAMLST